MNLTVDRSINKTYIMLVKEIKQETKILMAQYGRTNMQERSHFSWPGTLCLRGLNLFLPLSDSWHISDVYFFALALTCL